MMPPRSLRIQTGLDNDLFLTSVPDPHPDPDPSLLPLKC
jgi:hypothetical protein